MLWNPIIMECSWHFRLIRSFCRGYLSNLNVYIYIHVFVGSYITQESSEWEWLWNTLTHLKRKSETYETILFLHTTETCS